MSKTATIQPVPDPEPNKGPRRRRFTGEYKARVLAECDAAIDPGQIGAILRREGLYSSSLVEWRRLRTQGGAAGLVPKKRGRPPKDPAAQAGQKQIERLERENAKLLERLRHSEIIIQAQKKLAEVLASLPGSTNENDE
jgi:transposase